MVCIRNARSDDIFHQVFVELILFLFFYFICIKESGIPASVMSMQQNGRETEPGADANASPEYSSENDALDGAISDMMDGVVANSAYRIRSNFAIVISLCLHACIIRLFFCLLFCFIS